MSEHIEIDAMAVRAETITTAADQVERELAARPTPPLSAAAMHYLLDGRTSPRGSTAQELLDLGLVVRGPYAWSLTSWGDELRGRLKRVQLSTTLVERLRVCRELLDHATTLAEAGPALSKEARWLALSEIVGLLSLTRDHATRIVTELEPTLPSTERTPPR